MQNVPNLEILKQLEELENASSKKGRPKTALQLAKLNDTKNKKKKTSKIEKPVTIEDEEDIDYEETEETEFLEDSDAISMEIENSLNKNTTKSRETKTNVQGMDISSIDFIAASANDMSTIKETTALNEDNLLSTIKLYKKKHIKHLYCFVDQPKVTKEIVAYPLTYDKKCLYCHEYVKGPPIFLPHSFDPKRNTIVLTKDGFCSDKFCDKLAIISRNKSNMSQILSLTGKLRRWLGFPVSDGLVGIPLSARSDFTNYGTLSEEEWREKQKQVNITVKEFPALFVETYLEETDIKQREEEKKKIFLQLHSIRATADQQQNYKENIERVVKEQNKLNAPEQQSKLAKKLNPNSK